MAKLKPLLESVIASVLFVILVSAWDMWSGHFNLASEAIGAVVYFVLYFAGMSTWARLRQDRARAAATPDN